MWNSFIKVVPKSAIRLFIFLFDFTAPRAREAGTNEAIDEIKGEKGGQHVKEDFFPQDHDETDEQGDADGLGKSALRTQAQRFEARIFYGADHHRRQKDQDHGDKIVPFAEGLFVFIEM